MADDTVNVMSKTAINLELTFGDQAIEEMAVGNLKLTFIVAHDPVQGITAKLDACQLIAFDAHPSLPHPGAPLSGPHVHRIELQTAAEPPDGSNNSTQIPDNDPDQTEDEDWSNDTAAALMARSRGKMPAQDSLMQTPDNDPNDETDEDDWKAKGVERLLRAAMTTEPHTVQTPDNDPNDETDEDDWKAKGVERLLRAAMATQPHTEIPESPYASTTSSPNTQESRPRDQRASAGSSRTSGGRGRQRKRERDED